MFQSNQRVECINDIFPPEIGRLYSITPIDGGIYKIRDIAPGQTPNLDPEIAVTLRGIKNPAGQGGLERAFSADRFRALD